MKPREVGMLVALGALWGGSFLFIRVAAPALGPLVLVDLRVLLASAVLLLYAAALGRRPALRMRWGDFLALGALNVAIPFALIATAQLRLPASYGAILQAMVPPFTALVAGLWTGEALTARIAAGLALGLLGVATLVGWSPLPLDAGTLLAVGASLLASLFYGIGGVYAKARFRDTPPLTLAIGQLLAAGLLVLPFAAARPPTAAPTRGVLLALGGLVLLSTALAYLLYFALLVRVGPTKTHSVTYLVPFFGLLWGALALGETIGAGTLVGLVIVLLSVALVTGLRLRPGEDLALPLRRRSVPTNGE